MLDSLHNLLKECGLSIEPHFNTGKPVRQNSEWFVGQTWEDNGKTYYLAHFGDFKQGIKKTWMSEGDYSDVEKNEFQRRAKELSQEENEIRHQAQEETAASCQELFKGLQTSGHTSSYLKRKQIDAGELFGARWKENGENEPIICVPLRDTEGKLWNIQRIYAQKLSKGDKFFGPGGKIDGCFHILREDYLGEIGDIRSLKPTRVYLCEGYATALSIKLALGSGDFQVVATFNANNLVSVAKELKKAWSSSEFVVCADNDAFTIINGKPQNVGLEKGKKACGEALGVLRYPVFSTPTKGFTDFNDLHCAEGLEQVVRQLEKQKVDLTEDVISSEITQLDLAYDRKGNPEIPPEKTVADHFLKYFKNDFRTQDKSLWFYNGTHWEECQTAHINRIKRTLNFLVGGALSSRDLESLYKTLFIYLDTVPQGVDLYKPNPFVCNFKNGSLHLTKENEFKFKTHERDDYLTSTLPFEKPEDSPPAPMFQAFLERTWAAHPEKDKIIRLVKQIMGSCLIQAFPVIALFQGHSGSGKSTLIRVMVSLLSRENVCSVGPTDMHGFLMENMVAKLVNYDTDIDTHKPIQDSVVKKLIDRQPIKINRKGKTVVDAFVPAVHLFACNDVPKTLDGVSKAYGRRFKVIPCDNVVDQGSEILDYANVLVEKEVSGIVAIALSGLKDLVAQGGRFESVDASGEYIERMEMDSDPVAQWLGDIALGDMDFDNVRLTLDKEAAPKDCIEAPKAWSNFDLWQEASIKDVRQKIGKKRFFDSLRKKKYEIVQCTKTRHVKGLRISSAQSSVV